MDIIWLEAIATKVEAIAIRLDAIVTRVGAIAIRLDIFSSNKNSGTPLCRMRCLRLILVFASSAAHGFFGANGFFRSSLFVSFGSTACSGN